jgi:uncharacterized protein YbjT (DUF2867 family)
MHVFLAGATGVLGRRIVPLLLDEGHRVTGLPRDAASARSLRGLGADAVVADATDLEAMVRVVGEARPDVLMNQLTDLRSGVGPANSALRLASSATLAAEAEAAGVRRVVAQSIAWAHAAGDRPAPCRTRLGAPRHASEPQSGRMMLRSAVQQRGRALAGA